MNGGVRARSCAAKLHRIERPHALKIPARRAEYSLTENVASPFQAEPRHDQDCWPLTPVKEEEGDQQIHSTKIKGYRIEAGEIEQLSRWRYATVYSPSVTAARDIGVVIRLKRKIYNDADVEKKHAVMTIHVDCNVQTAVLLMRLLRESGDGTKKL